MSTPVLERREPARDTLREDAARLRERAARLHAMVIDQPDAEMRRDSSRNQITMQGLGHEPETATSSFDSEAATRMASYEVDGVAATAAATWGGQDDAAVAGAREAVIGASAATHQRFARATAALPAAMYARAMARHSVRTVQDETVEDRARVADRSDYPRAWERDQAEQIERQ